MQDTDSKPKEQALDEISNIRSKTLQRVVLADEVLRYAAGEGDSQVWDEYIVHRESDLFDPSIDEAINPPRAGNDGYIGVRRLKRLLAEDAGPELLGEETAREWFDRDQSTICDLLVALRHFYL